MLTKQQKNLLFFIKNFQEEHGIAPSYDEMRCALNQKSKSSVHMLLNALVERGFVRKLNNKARAIEIIKFIEKGSLALSVRDNISAPQEKNKCSVSNQAKDSTVSYFPFYGKQNTVFSIKVFLSTPEKILSIPKDSLFSYVEESDYCAIQVSGDALKEMAILDDDILFFKMGLDAEEGQLVLAMVDDDTIHMKKWEIKDDKVILSLGNKYMIPQVYDAHRVHIKGTMVALTRQSLISNPLKDTQADKTAR